MSKELSGIEYQQFMLDLLMGQSKEVDSLSIYRPQKRASEDCVTVEVTIPVTVSLKHHRAYRGARRDGYQVEPNEEAGTTIESIEPESDATWEEIIEAEVERLHQDGALKEL